MPRKPTGKPPGRPRKDDAAEAALAAAEKTGAPVGEAAKRLGVSRSTAFALKASQRAGKGAPARSQTSAAPMGPEAPPGPIAGVCGAPGPDGLRCAMPPHRDGDHLANGRAWASASPLDRLRAYAAGDPEALAALEALLQPPEEGLGRDELLALRDGLVLAAKLVREASESRKGGDEADDGRLLRALQRLEGLGKTVATVKAKRPHEDGPDEVTRRLVEVRDAAIARVGILTSEAAVRFATKRAELDTWCAGLGAFGAEVKTRVDAMLGGPAT